MSNLLFRAGAIVLIGALSGCASATAIPVSYNSPVQGFRIYDIKPILIVNGSTTSIELIPNYNKAYAVQFSTFLAKQEYTLELEKGFLKKLDGKQDTTPIIELLRDIVKTFGPTVGKAMSSDINGGLENRFQVYEFIFDEGGTLIELRPLISSKGSLLSVKTTKTVVSNVPQTPPPINPQTSKDSSIPQVGVINQ